MEQATIDAIRFNLDGICFTERVDYGVKPDWYHPEGARFENGRPLTNCAYPAYFAELEEMRERYGKVLWCGRGLEFGIQKETIPAYEKLFGEWQDHLDMVLLSVHEIGNLEFWTNEYQEGKTQLEFTRGYYEAVLDCIEHFDSWSVLAHLDLIRYHDYSGEGPLPFESTEDIVAAILEKTIEGGHGLEINTSALCHGEKAPMPSRDILTLYRDLGGTILTFGSGCIRQGQLGAYLKVAEDMARSLGFSSFCTFENLEPHHHIL
jgi:histidinol-phosphatase (PHP family)